MSRLRGDHAELENTPSFDSMNPKELVVKRKYDEVVEKVDAGI